MTDIPEEPVEDPEAVPEPEPAPVEPAGPETPETPTEAPQPARWLVLTRVFYVDVDGNEFFCGPGETIDDAYIEQVLADSVTPAG